MDDGFQHPVRCLFPQFAVSPEGPLFVPDLLVERRDIDALQFGDLREKLLLRLPRPAEFSPDAADFGQQFFAVPHQNDVHKVRHRLCVKGAGTAADDDGVSLGAVFGKRRDARQVQHRQDVGIAELVLEGEPHKVHFL